jgi:peroxiredoxin
MFLVGLLMIGLCITNVLLIKQNHDLKATRIRNEPQYLKQGQKVPPLVAQRVSGETATINFGESQKTILFVFAPGCVPCEYTGPKWKLIENACAHEKCRSFALSLGTDNSKSVAFLSAYRLQSEVLTNLSSQTRAAYQLSVTPLTIVVDAQGKVEKIWPGAFNDDMKSDTERYFGISLTDKTSN